jgi:hypothetical protein
MGKGYFVEYHFVESHKVDRKWDHPLKVSIKAGVPKLNPLGDSGGLEVAISWVYLYQWGDAMDVREEGEAKRLGTSSKVRLDHFVESQI